ncbi:MAG: phosphoadenylyl-sulfate reductase [Lentisphaeria bacterium]
MQNKIQLYKDILSPLSPIERIKWANNHFGEYLTFASSLGAEDQVITHIIATENLPIEIFTLDTGRLFNETLQLLADTQNQYNIKIKTYYPDAIALENLVNNHGINLFYQSVELRKKCCQIRKIQPLQRALHYKKAWICGLRNEQSVTRTSQSVVEWDEINQIIKINPIIEWTENQVWNFISRYCIPYNTLHDIGYPSIGCSPCSKPVKKIHDSRTGRWAWELPEQKECGLHH